MGRKAPAAAHPAQRAAVPPPRRRRMGLVEEPRSRCDIAKRHFSSFESEKECERFSTGDLGHL